MRTRDAIKLFGLNNILVETDIHRIEREKDVDFGHRLKASAKEERRFYPQFPERLRREADKMAEH